jgi:hypothetical protein
MVEEHRSAIHLVERHEHLAVAAALELVAMIASESFVEAIKIVDLAVDDGMNVPVVTVYGLMTVGGEIIDGETVVAQR